MIRRIYETIVYGDNIASLAAFYADVLGLRYVKPLSTLAAVFRLPDGGILLIFNAAEAAKPGREVPSHGAAGPGHVAFSIDKDEYDTWKSRLAAAGVPIEREITWGTGARSIYVRDPANNSVELVEGEIWPP
jgi:catechol 2,3-dioxygenase-like lactoylglutathione lyase family enzyme